MPTVAPTPVPLDMLPGGDLNPIDWIDVGDGMGGAMQSSLMRGTPGAFRAYQRRQVRGPETLAQGREVWLQSRPYDRGAGAFSPAKLTLSPTGPGSTPATRVARRICS